MNYFHKRILFTALLCCVSLITSCPSHTYIYSYEDLHGLLEDRVTLEEKEKIVIPFEANAEMKAFAMRISRSGQGTNSRCKRLVEGILNKSELNVQYNKALSKTAIDLFYEGEGNCLAYTNLFIALARSVGIRAFYVDASLLVSDVEEKEGMIVNNGHICAAVYAEPELLFIDFTKRVYKHIIGYKFIDDAEAIAHYYNNLGYEKRKVGQRKFSKAENMEGIDEFVMATKVCPDFYRAYNNLGVAYQQLGNFPKAIDYYKQAIAINAEFASAYSNLGMIFFSTDDFTQAQKYFRKAIRYAKSNHYNYYYLGVIEMKKKNFKEAQKLLMKACRIREDFSLAHLSLSQIYRQQGDLEKADKELEKARHKK
ncbi:tetratricopeptide repeat protein [candidate division CSSED10-310 bacterium]|uniref:Tetratricopeptide repeat protein n=1 Tax=candidate division CSSED10-310 bacterium TaxID=2855610 RepID=A0ABV6Z0P5_UNCC1